MKELCTLAFLGVNAWLDIRKKEISLLSVVIFAAAGAVRYIESGRSMMEVIMPLGIGLVFFTLSLLTSGSVGLGDAWILLALGLILETGEFLGTLCIGMLLAGGWALILLVIRKKSRNTEIPFVPFLLVGYVGGMLL